MKRLLIKLEINGKQETADMEFLENWNEVPADLYPHLASLYLATEKRMSKYDKVVRAFTLLAWKHWRVIEQLEADELYDLLQLSQWVFDKLDLTVNHIPQIKLKEETLYGPADGMDNLRFGEWCAAATFADLYAHEEKMEHLRSLAACLYRPAGTGDEYTPGKATYRGDIRQRFNDQLIAGRAKELTGYSYPVLQGIYVWFCSCRFQIFSQYEALKSGEKKSDEPADWLGLYDDLRGDPKFAPAEKLEEEFLHTVLDSQQRAKIKWEELKDKYKL